ncbi:aminotransferase [Teredinibacter turnerae]|uniref:aminotransferase n=1 Tax=Teredinibacter turnerae TaxID=2426 RepID=UPI0005A2BEA7
MNAVTTPEHDLETIDKMSLLHPASSVTDLRDNGPSIIKKGQGNFIFDTNNVRYLDAVAGLWCVNVGYGRQELADAMSSSAQNLGYYHSFSNASNADQILLGQELLRVAPQNLSKVFFGSGGSDANDTLLKIAWHYHAIRGNSKKVKIIARDQAYHGTSISTASLTGLPSFHKDYPLPLDFVLHTGCPHYYRFAQDGETETEFCDRLVSEVARLIEQEGADNIAAFIAEPIQAAGGIIVPPKGYFEKLHPLLKTNNILLIADEVVCGMGRLGHWFASPEFGMQPDMIALAKGLTSGYFPLSAAMISDDVYQVLLEGSAKHGAFYHGYTYSGHPVGAAVARANLALMHQENLLAKTRENGEYLHEKLRSEVLPHPLVGEIRGRGLLAGIQLVTNKQTRELPAPAQKWPQMLAAAIRAEGVIVRPLPSVATLAMSPPFTITREEIDIVITAILKALAAFK